MKPSRKCKQCLSTPSENIPCISGTALVFDTVHEIHPSPSLPIRGTDSDVAGVVADTMFKNRVNDSRIVISASLEQVV